MDILETRYRPTTVFLQELKAPVAVCDTHGELLTATHEARELLLRLCGNESLPQDLWERLEKVAAGEAVEWRSALAPNVLGCTRYHYPGGFVLLMKEVSHKHAELSRRLHSQRLEATGRLVASVAHELRNAVASIVYSTELLTMTGSEVTPDVLQETVGEMVVASRQLQASVNSLLGYARLGPSVFIPVSLREVMTRSQGFLRSVYRSPTRQLTVEIPAAAEWVQGNTLIIEQIFVNLLLNAAEAAGDRALQVRVQSDLARVPGAPLDAPEFVRVRVVDDGPGIPPRLRDAIFQPFVSMRENGTGLGLPIAAEAASNLGGTLVLEESAVGASFAVYLPRRVDEGGSR